ncbi:MAG TPA: ABC transporter ATP-binding protein [Phycisphaerales bacterium]|nr:ABC transporter ATP-binding protein [Phycisphaerales bacterium]
MSFSTATRSIEAGPLAQPRGDAGPVVVRLVDVGKCYHIYDKPADRLKQSLLGWRKRYYREFWALRGVSLELRRGGALGVLGRNGSGKSTLLQLIAGTLAPTEGTVEVAGRVAALLELGSGFNPEFTGRENVYLNGAILGFTRREVDEKFDAIAGFADIGAFLDQPVKTYSSGMLVRLAFAVQVQVEPDLLIVDEALAVGDALFQKRCIQRIEELRGKGVTLLFVSHDQESVRTLTDQALLLEEGRPRAAGPSGEVLLEYRRLLHDQEKRWYSRELSQKRAHAAAPRPGAAQAGRSFGDLDAEVLAVRVLDGDGNDASYFAPGDIMRVRVECVAHKELSHLNINLRVRSRAGVKIHSWGTFNQDLRVINGHEAGEVIWERRFAAGEGFTVEFACTLRLGTDLYEIQAAIVEEQDLSYTAQRVLHWLDEAAFFQVAVRKDVNFFGGVTDMGMRAHVIG